MSLDQRSLDKLQGVHPALAGVIKAAAERTQFRVTEGLRSRERQVLLVKQKKSKTLNSRHITGHAIDFIAIGTDDVATYDLPDMKRVAGVIKAVAQEQGVKIAWGGDWKGAWDTPHIELDRKAYPAIGVSTTTRVVEAAKTPPAAATTGVAVGAGAVAAGPSLPALPPPPDISPYTAWQSFGEAVASLGAWITARPLLTVLCVAWACVMAFLPQIMERVPWLRSSPSS